MAETRERIPNEVKAGYWARMGLSVRDAINMHYISGQMTKDPETQKRPWGNITEHCLVEVARAEALGRWIGLPEELFLDMKMGAVLHDFAKRQEITATREANKTGSSPLETVKLEQQKGELLLRNSGFSDRVRRFASSAGGHASQLVEAQRILDKPTLSDEDWAYLIVHYVDDCSIEADWVRPSQVDGQGNRFNIIDYRAEENKAKTAYSRISEEIGAELSEHPILGGMNNHDAMSIVSHQIEERLVQRIKDRTGEVVDPLAIPELIDQKIKDAINQSVDLAEARELALDLSNKLKV